jgi:acyl-coenzyme A synthetase/AMP-(fatty) acid ligase
MLLSGAISRYDLSSLRLITYGTEPMPESTLLWIKTALPHVRLKQTYGMSEIGILKSRSRADDSLWLKLGGRGVDIKIRDSILWIKSPVAMLGYLNAEDPFEVGGYINTGDRVEQDNEWLKILGRESEVINVGGYKVFPTEVESVLHQMPEVADAVVFGSPNPLTGHAVNAVIKLRSELSLSEFKAAMRKFCRKHLEPYKIPVKILLTHEDLHSERFKKNRNVSNAFVH